MIVYCFSNAFVSLWILSLLLFVSIICWIKRYKIFSSFCCNAKIYVFKLKPHHSKIGESRNQKKHNDSVKVNGKFIYELVERKKAAKKKSDGFSLFVVITALVWFNLFFFVSFFFFAVHVDLLLSIANHQVPTANG